MRRNLFWLSDKQWAKIEPLLPTDVRGKARVDDRKVLSGILHVLKSGCRWCDCPPDYGPPTTIYNRFVRWAERGVWERLFQNLAKRGRSTGTQMIDSTHIKAHRSASGGKGGSKKQAIGRSRGGRNTKIHAIADAKGRLLSLTLTGGEAHDCPVSEPLIDTTKAPKKFLADKAYDSAELRKALKKRGTKPVIPNKFNRKKPFSFSKKAYKERHLIENAFCRLEDFRRIATRYDRLARNFAASIYLVAAVVWWIL
ncbi:IS5 family transposase [Acidocella aminolytica]|uniref:IS5 family transposase n=3 Tax=Acidocella aminolytica TaxID=33998 RepID=UPI0011149D75|nr:IS5 family transposase [Acidocella aminolytica]